MGRVLSIRSPSLKFRHSMTRGGEFPDNSWLWWLHLSSVIFDSFLGARYQSTAKWDGLPNIVVDLESLKSRCWPSQGPFKETREEYFLVVSGCGAQHPLARGSFILYCIICMCPSLYTPISSFLRRPVITFKCLCESQMILQEVFSYGICKDPIFQMPLDSEVQLKLWVNVSFL